jgi:Zn-dependent protease
MRSGSIPLVRVAGIQIGVDPSWFLVLFLIVYLLTGTYQDVLGGTQTEAFLAAAASALLFFGSLILHELGHALVARRLGIGIAGIDLFFFGGVAKMTSDTRSPGAEFKVAAAGPAVTLLVVVATSVVGVALAGSWPEFRDASPLSSEIVQTTAPVAVLSWLAMINAFLFAFNLIPGFPLDGGRIARSIAWKITGDRLRATKIAAALGRFFAYVLIALGIAGLATGSVFSGIWTMVLGWFLLQAATGAVAQTKFMSRLEDVTVADIMDSEPVAIPATTPPDRALQEYFLRYRWSWFPVIDEDGRFLGLIHQGPVETADRRGEETPVGKLSDHRAANWSVGASDPVEALLGRDGLRELGALMAVDDAGVLRGVVTLEQVQRALTAATASLSQ